MKYIINLIIILSILFTYSCGGGDSSSNDGTDNIPPRFSGFLLATSVDKDSAYVAWGSRVIMLLR